MKKIIYKKLFNEILIFFVTASFTLTLIIWVIQAVNYLDIVTEDGHSFKVYFYYTLLSIPKVFSKTLPFVFFLSVFYVVSYYEEKSQLLVYWTHGEHKKKFVNNIIGFSTIFLLVQLFFLVFFVPFSQDKSRSFIRNSNLDFFPNLIKPKKFVDTVENLTIFVESIDKNGIYKNIILKDKISELSSQIIIAESGNIVIKKNGKILLLNNGRIMQGSDGKNSTIFSFKETQINLDKYSTKTTVYPKIQELGTFNLIRCTNNLFNNSSYKNLSDSLNCEINFLDNLIQELLKRLYLPVYIPLMALIGSLLVLKSKNSHGYPSFKIKVFLIGFLFLILSEVTVNFTGLNNFYNILFLMTPVLSFIIINKILNVKLGKA